MATHTEAGLFGLDRFQKWLNKQGALQHFMLSLRHPVRSIRLCVFLSEVPPGMLPFDARSHQDWDHWGSP